jgi:hypothetical protein
MFGVGSAGRIATSLLKGNRKMANTNAPFGFRQASGTGTTPSYEQIEASIASNYTTPIFFGDPVYPLDTGYIAGSSITPGTVQIAGIFVGCKYLSTSQKRTVWSNYWPGSDNNGAVTAYIVTDPNANFLVQVGGSSTTGLVQADIGANLQVAYGTGNTANGISGAYVVYNSGAVTSTLPFRLKSLVTEPPGSNGTESGAYNYVIVGFNNVSTKQLTSVG